MERKKPHCRTCGRPTLGHPYIGRQLSCKAESSDASQELRSVSRSASEESEDWPQDYLIPTSSRSNGGPKFDAMLARLAKWKPPSNAPPRYTPEVISEPSFEIPASGVFHRRNPNLQTPPRRRVQAAPPPVNMGPPTEIMGPDSSASAATVLGSEGDRRTLSRLGTLVAGIYSVKEENLQPMREQAMRYGLYSDAVTPHLSAASGSRDAWLITSRSPSNVQHVTDALRRSSGTYMNEPRSQHRNVKGQILMTFFFAAVMFLLSRFALVGSAHLLSTLA